jgi:hypothetical protein
VRLSAVQVTALKAFAGPLGNGYSRGSRTVESLAEHGFVKLTIRVVRPTVVRRGRQHLKLVPWGFATEAGKEFLAKLT